MIVPGMPENEPERLKSLYDSHLFHTPIEQGFERITRLTKKIFDVPIVAISLIDKETQWFKSVIGLDANSTPRDISFCGHTILKDDVLVVDDAQLDPRFSDNPLVTESPSIRFYAGCPIHTVNEHRIGALCIIDTRPRQISSHDKIILKDIASLVDTEIRNHQHIHPPEKKLHELNAEKRKELLDPLTRLWNKTGITQVIEYQRKLSKFNKSEFGLIQLSVDSLQAFVTEYGHEAGNDLLKAITQTLINSCGCEDSIGYWGGKEFVIVLPCEEQPDVLAVANRIRKNIASEQHLTRVGRVRTTATIGVVFFNPKIHLNTVNLLTEAAHALQEGKLQGGNKIIIK
ncbi:sensor domain-containing diguanylate cyclase [Legionella sp. 16cNR16C]|uniref:sensor domain-containing diguanylate cyclase n=1 Tax=Legionella sp. 16cNR16C TaxID=2905656 RepID=UPI001E2DE5F8|nr:sensor domain-containing diguanylate cyclase [Legionella sp. 16cNR16C]MCE3046276.1 sensor domain-containing diguanylate cyclase [Legionella sp. 16cNR16C]